MITSLRISCMIRVYIGSDDVEASGQQWPRVELSRHYWRDSITWKSKMPPKKHDRSTSSVNVASSAKRPQTEGAAASEVEERSQSTGLGDDQQIVVSVDS